MLPACLPHAARINTFGVTSSTGVGNSRVEQDATALIYATPQEIKRIKTKEKLTPSGFRDDKSSAAAELKALQYRTSDAEKDKTLDKKMMRTQSMRLQDVRLQVLPAPNVFIFLSAPSLPPTAPLGGAQASLGTRGSGRAPLTITAARPRPQLGFPL